MNRLAFFFLLAACVWHCTSTRFEAIHLAAYGAEVDFEFTDAHEKLSIDVTYPMEEQTIPAYEQIANRYRVHLNTEDTTAIYRLYPTEQYVMVDTSQRILYVAYSYREETK